MQPTTFDAKVLTVAYKEFLALDLSALLSKNGVHYDVKGILDYEGIKKL